MKKSISVTLVLVSMVCALAGALSVYVRLGIKPHYGDLIAGNLAWNDTVKARDYALSISFITIFALCYTILNWLTGCIRRRGGVGMEQGFHQVLLLAMLPICYVLGLVFFKDSHDHTMLLLSTLLIIFTSLLAGRMARRRWMLASPSVVIDVLGSLVSSLLLGAASGLGVIMLISRVIAPASFQSSDSVWSFILGGMGIAFALSVWMTSGKRDGDPIAPPRRRMGLGMIAVQLGIPLLFVSMVPPRPINDSVVWYGESLSIYFWILIYGLIAIGYIDLLRRVRLIFKGSADVGSLSRVSWAISPMCLLAIVSVLAIRPVAPPTMLGDDYHWGEQLLPFWSFIEFGSMPYVDYTPARGLINYLPGLVASVFADGSASAFTITTPIVAIFYHALALFLLVRFCGRGIGFTLALLLPVTGIAEIQILVAAMLLVMAWGAWRWRPAAWLVWWVVLGTLLVLLAPGQGGLSVLSTAPLGLYIFIKAVRTELSRLLITGMVSGAVGLLLMTLTPIGPMVLGAVRYGLEQSSVNDVAHSVPWSRSASISGIPWRGGNWPMPMPYAMWELMRAGFPVFAALCGVFTWHMLRNTKGPRRIIGTAIASSVFVYLTLMTFRALGRIDAAPSRTIMPMLFATAVALPVLIRFMAGSSRRIGFQLMILPLAFLVSLSSGSKVLRPSTGIAYPVNVRQYPRELMLGEDIGAPKVGRVQIKQERADDIRSLSETLSLVLDEGEGFVDLTNHSSMHFYLDREPGLNTTSLYNTVHRGQQVRAVERIHERPFRAALADPNRSQPWDGGGPSLRAPILWRYIVQRFTPVQINGWTLLLDDNRLSTLPTNAIAPRDESHRRAMLEEAFPVRPLAKLPIAWGRSLESLDGSALRVIASLEIDPVAGLEPIANEPGSWRVVSFPVVLEVQLAQPGLSGSQGGLLLLHAQFSDGVSPAASIGWDSGIRPSAVMSTAAQRTRLTCLLESGNHIIPLDASADWLLGQSTRITLKLERLPLGTRVSGISVRLGQRLGADEVDELAGESR